MTKFKTNAKTLMEDIIKSREITRSSLTDEVKNELINTVGEYTWECGCSFRKAFQIAREAYNELFPESVTLWCEENEPSAWQATTKAEAERCRKEIWLGAYSNSELKEKNEDGTYKYIPICRYVFWVCKDGNLEPMRRAKQSSKSK